MSMMDEYVNAVRVLRAALIIAAEETVGSDNERGKAQIIQRWCAQAEELLGMSD